MEAFLKFFFYIIRKKMSVVFFSIFIHQNPGSVSAATATGSSYLH
jgi:hypothetical protein